MQLNMSFFQAEERSGFLVTEKRKKVWAVELELLEKFDEICRKHHLSWYAYYGTLLGAVRHQGFIPWDDDIDVIMFRDDYEKFQIIAPQEFTEPYFYQNSYTDQVIWPFSKLRDSRTTAIESCFTGLGDSFHQGIFIDIFPFDSAREPNNLQMDLAVEMQHLLWIGITNPELALQVVTQEPPESVLKQYMLDYLGKNLQQRFRIFENYNLASLEKSKKVNYILSELVIHDCQSVDKDWFRETVYLPFENMRIPVPVEYDKILRNCYGNYHEFVQGGSAHEGLLIEPDIPYKEYFSHL